MMSQPPTTSHAQERFQKHALGRTSKSWDHQVLVCLYPLHQTLLPCLRFLTTTSLLPSEVQLLSSSLINLLLLAESPQAKILNYVLWIGGVGIFLLCSEPLKWNVAIERIPSLRFRRAGRIISAGTSFLSALSEGLNASQPSEEAVSEEPNCFQYHPQFKRNHLHSKSLKENGDIHHERATSMSIHANHVGEQGNGETPAPSPYIRKRSLTAPSVPNMPGPARQSPRPGRRKTFNSQNRSGFMSLTHKQATMRKLIYTIYAYVVAAVLIMGPIRMVVAARALRGFDPVCWAVGYLFGQVPIVRLLVEEYGLESAIPLPQTGVWRSSDIDWNFGDPEWLRQLFGGVVGQANTRLLLLGYFAFILMLGILIVLGLSSAVEVDTRRKVFHGTMVAMLMPTAFIDPPFLSLGLGVALAIFLALEVVRAAQLRPLSKPLARFLTPYVDGRDLRGPVVVSHIFLLIGCAIPFWLSLADVDLEEASSESGTQPWMNWDLLSVHRNVDMLAGVICVGLGDAAASLIGRRFGRRKWPWAGGKSLEGSAAFAIAVTVGLAVAKAWLWAGGWLVPVPTLFGGNDSGWKVVVMLTAWLGKCAIAGTMASFCEAVLTGCNDNVVVPVVLWLAVRGLEI